jgi:hypothetical protein
MGWIITAAVVAVILCLMFFRVKLLVGYEGDFEFAVKYLFFTVRINKRKEGKAKKEPKKPKQKPDIIGLIKSIDRYRAILMNLAHSAKKRMRIDRLYIKLIIKEEDPSKTAILYGEACAVVYTATAYLCGSFNVKSHDIIVRPVFNEGSPEAAFECVLSMMLGNIIIVTVSQSSAFINAIIKANKSNKPAIKPAKDGAVK